MIPFTQTFQIDFFIMQISKIADIFPKKLLELCNFVKGNCLYINFHILAETKFSWSNSNEVFRDGFFYCCFQEPNASVEKETGVAGHFTHTKPKRRNDMPDSMVPGIL